MSETPSVNSIVSDVAKRLDALWREAVIVATDESIEEHDGDELRRAVRMLGCASAALSSCRVACEEH